MRPSQTPFFQSTPRPGKPHLRLRPWPEHEITYLPYGWVVQEGCGVGLNIAAKAWAVRWNYAHRNEPAAGSRVHGRFG